MRAKAPDPTNPHGPDGISRDVLQIKAAQCTYKMPPSESMQRIAGYSSRRITMKESRHGSWFEQNQTKSLNE